tara:strand:+ start:1118 stop:1663 length:546 start_codon:yes stop_codon:yes gene_type:complete
MKKIIFQIIGIVNNLFYKKEYIDFYKDSESYNIFKIGVFQKIIGFNRNISWPVHRSTTILAPQNIIPGTRSPGISKYCHIDGRNGIKFGKNVWVGPNVKIISMNHDPNDYSKYLSSRSILIGDNCWIGAGSIILPGVNIGQHTIVAAGSIVTKSFEGTDQIIGGNPAKFIKKVPKYTFNGG